MSTRRSDELADRVTRLGTETAFAVSAEADEWKGQGHTVYPFHLGDMDLPTPENIVEAAFKAIRDGKTGYCPNAGIPQLREALAADVGASRGLALGPQNVAVGPRVSQTSHGLPQSTASEHGPGTRRPREGGEDDLAFAPLDVSWRSLAQLAFAAVADAFHLPKRKHGFREVFGQQVIG